MNLSATCGGPAGQPAAGIKGRRTSSCNGSKRQEAGRLQSKALLNERPCEQQLTTCGVQRAAAHLLARRPVKRKHHKAKGATCKILDLRAQAAARARGIAQAARAFPHARGQPHAGCTTLAGAGGQQLAGVGGAWVPHLLVPWVALQQVAGTASASRHDGASASALRRPCRSAASWNIQEGVTSGSRSVACAEPAWLCLNRALVHTNQQTASPENGKQEVRVARNRG